VLLVDLLARCRTLEERAARLYRSFAAAQLNDRELAALWTALAAHEDEHAGSIREAQEGLTPQERDSTAVEGCESTLADVADRLRHAESLGTDVTPDGRLAAALDLELSELEALRQLCLHASGVSGVIAGEHSHLHRLADTAMRRSRDGHVRLAAAVLLARDRLAADVAARS
jgi:hypothetical protein